MGRKKEKGLLPQVTAVSWQVRLPGGEKKERGRILTGILFLAAVFGCTLSVLEMLEPPVDKKVFLGGIFFLAVIWQIICWNKKTCAWGQMILWASVILFAIFRWDRILTGGRMAANTALEKTNIIYHLNFRLFQIDKPDPEGELFFLLVMFCWFVGLLAFVTIYRMSVGGLTVLILLIIGAGLWLGEMPSHLPFFLMMGAVYGGAVFFYAGGLPGGRIRRRTVCLMVISFGLILSVSQWLIRPALEPKLFAFHDTVSAAERKFEKWIWEDGLSGLPFLNGFGSPDFTDGALGNTAPSFEEEIVLTVTFNREPVGDVYLRGYAGEIYTGSSWIKPQEEDFLEASAGWPQSPYGAGLAVQDLYRSSLVKAAEEIGLTEGGWDLEMKLDYKDTDGDYSFLPYEAELTDATEAVGDGWNLRKNDGPLRAEGTLRSIPVTVLSSLEWETEESELKRAYSDYVDSHYRSVPAEGVERLMAYAEDLMEKTGQKGADLIPYIQEELGRRCRYSTSLDPVPVGGDFAEHFFFESKEGFCTHFATTAVLLYRMVGVPARYRTGYVIHREDFQYRGGEEWKAVVMDSQAHAWVEVYLDNWGWVPVEVTPGYGGGDLMEGEETAWSSPSATEAPREEITASPTPQDSPVPSGEEPEGQGGAERPTQVLVTPAPWLGAIFTILKMLLAVAAAVLLVLMRRRFLAARRQRRLNQKDPSAVILEISYELQEVLGAAGYAAGEELRDQEYGRWMAEHFPGEPGKEFPHFMKLAQKAAYSGEKCTAGEVLWCRQFCEGVKKEIWKSLSPAKKFWWRYIKCF